MKGGKAAKKEDAAAAKPAAAKPAEVGQCRLTL